MSELVLSPKYKAFLRHNAEAEALEGTTAAGKTTVGAFKFMLLHSRQKNCILSRLNLSEMQKKISSIQIWESLIFSESM